LRAAEIDRRFSMSPNYRMYSLCDVNGRWIGFVDGREGEDVRWTKMQ
jgi:hypothetical protein